MVMFDYTQGKFWGGSWYPYWSLILISVLGGLFGLDHLWLRSPTTAISKFIVNIFTLGLWYFYDLVQILGEKESVMKNGLSAPFVGPLGIGAGVFTDDNPDGPRSKSPFRYLAYLALMVLPFGFDYFVAGDTYGAIAKFLSIIIFLLWPIAIIWMIVTGFRAFFMPRTMFTDGSYRMFPYSFIMDTYGPSKLGPVDIGSQEDMCNQGERSWLGFLFSPITLAAQTAIGTVLPGLIPASQAVGAAVAATAVTAETAAESATSVIKAATEPAATAVRQTSAIVQQIPSTVSVLPAITQQATTGLHMATDAAIKKAIQHGGGGGNGMSDTALFLVFSILLGGGALIALQRITNLNPYDLLKKKDGQEWNDSPPEPRRLRGNAKT